MSHSNSNPPPFETLTIVGVGLLGGSIARAAKQRGLVQRVIGVGRSAAALSWIMAHPARPIPIVGTQRPERIAEIPDALTPRWTRADWYRVLEASMGETLP